jgi:hypothetical protein
LWRQLGGQFNFSESENLWNGILISIRQYIKEFRLFYYQKKLL